MTAQQITAYYSNLWQSPAILVLGRIAGNRSAYHVSDGNGNWAAVDHRWTGNGLDFQPRECPPMCACDDLMDCPIPAENDRLDAAQRHAEQRGG